MDWFFPQDTDKVKPDGSRQQVYGDDGLRARLICAACPVRKECWTENRDAPVGIFAGTDEVERRRMLNSARTREYRAAEAEGRVTRQLTIADIPAPIFRPHIAKPSSRVQIALYAFLRGHTMQEAAETAELSLDPVRRAVLDQQRHVS